MRQLIQKNSKKNTHICFTHPYCLNRWNGLVSEYSYAQIMKWHELIYVTYLGAFLWITWLAMYNISYLCKYMHIQSSRSCSRHAASLTAINDSTPITFPIVSIIKLVHISTHSKFQKTFPLYSHCSISFLAMWKREDYIFWPIHAHKLVAPFSKT